MFVVLFAVAGAVWLRGRYSKAGTIKKYRARVSHTLELRCGAHDAYRSTDVAHALDESRVPSHFAPYAYAMFCAAEEFRKAPGCAELDYSEIRGELTRLGS